MKCAVQVELAVMGPGDFDEVEFLWRASPGVGLYPGDDRESIARFLERNPGLSFVARDGDRTVGAVLCGHDGRRGYITHLAVAPSHRREGIGERLVERCLAALRREGIEKAHLFVFEHNMGARAFWRRLGWHDRGDLVTMSRYLTAEQSGKQDKP